MRTITALALILASARALAQTQTIKPGDVQAIDALGHVWTFGKIQDDFTGFAVFKDGKPTSLHGIILSWDGKTLTLTDHHPYRFDPATGRPWIPPQRTYNVSEHESGHLNTPLQQEPGALPSWRQSVKGFLERNPRVFDRLRQILTKLTGE